MFFSDKKGNSDLIKISALLIHAAKIDENYSNKEEHIIEKALLELGANKKDIEKIIKDALKLEEDSNQILDFTKEVKSLDDKEKIKILEHL